MKRTLKRLAVAAGIYLLLEWLFAYVTWAEGLFSPRGAPNTGALVLGVIYLGTRIVVRWVGPWVIGVAIARGSLPRARRRVA